MNAILLCSEITKMYVFFCHIKICILLATGKTFKGVATHVNMTRPTVTQNKVDTFLLSIQCFSLGGIYHRESTQIGYANMYKDIF